MAVGFQYVDVMRSGFLDHTILGLGVQGLALGAHGSRDGVRVLIAMGWGVRGSRIDGLRDLGSYSLFGGHRILDAMDFRIWFPRMLTWVFRVLFEKLE